MAIIRYKTSREHINSYGMFLVPSRRENERKVSKLTSLLFHYATLVLVRVVFPSTSDSYTAIPCPFLPFLSKPHKLTFLEN